MFFRIKKHKKGLVPDVKESIDKCLCTECPTNPDHAPLYCARGITSKAVEKVRALGCNCSLCPIYHEYGLSGCYLCLTPPGSRFKK